MLNGTKNAKETMSDVTMTMSERRIVANAMNQAGYDSVTPEMVQKVSNKWDFDVYVAVVGDAMVVYTPHWSHNNGINFVCF